MPSGVIHGVPVAPATAAPASANSIEAKFGTFVI
jgi:hypothetical protein